MVSGLTDPVAGHWLSTGKPLPRPRLTVCAAGEPGAGRGTEMELQTQRTAQHSACTASHAPVRWAVALSNVSPPDTHEERSRLWTEIYAPSLCPHRASPSRSLAVRDSDIFAF